MAEGRPAVQFTVEQKELQYAIKAIRAEADGKQLRKDLLREIRGVLTPLRDEARDAILSMESGGLPHEGEPLRQAIANQTVVEVRTGGRATGAAIKVKRRGMPRGFTNAAKWTNRTKWRHPVFKRTTSGGVEVDVWVDQTGKPRWFDDVMRRHVTEYRKAVLEAIYAMQKRILNRSRS